MDVLFAINVLTYKGSLVFLVQQEQWDYNLDDNMIMENERSMLE